MNIAYTAVSVHRHLELYQVDTTQPRNLQGSVEATFTWSSLLINAANLKSNLSFGSSEFKQPNTLPRLGRDLYLEGEKEEEEDDDDDDDDNDDNDDDDDDNDDDDDEEEDDDDGEDDDDDEQNQ
ncbi:hypothetical protein ElyMa_005002100 [Elysia marginata]|uniref:Uncharacterized protein n=1 Tax=Elysia marginata TaxID=1093978 RepID=A0AAV4J7G1_9GAST|nr:hypothetical protein ElyMa_005002100 [Elysia marginata]